MSELSHANPIEAENQRLVDLVSAVLVDPNLHTDLRMRLCEEITELLRPAPSHPSGVGHGAPHLISRGVAGDHLAGLMQAVLSDPNLHTDLRMRLYREIPRLVTEAQERAVRQGEKR
ncbi:MAG TPA: hypothetical protein VMD09_03210 [Solirubrobacteraceae bacterium]|nr:hypothetical protein [Solirubrobacteraceae bacterium]